MQELHSKSDMQIKHELHGIKGPHDKQKYKGAITDQMEASSGTSYCIDPGNIHHQNFPLSNFCMDGDVHSQQPRNNLPTFASNLDALTPDTLLSRGYDSQKDLQNFLSNYGGGAPPRDIETELSTAAITSQSFGVPNMPFKPGCSSDIAITDTGVLNNALWTNQTQRMRTYTKVCYCSFFGKFMDLFKFSIFTAYISRRDVIFPCYFKRESVKHHRGVLVLFILVDHVLNIYCQIQFLYIH